MCYQDLTFTNLFIYTEVCHLQYKSIRVLASIGMLKCWKLYPSIDIAVLDKTMSYMGKTIYRGI